MPVRSPAARHAADDRTPVEKKGGGSCAVGISFKPYLPSAGAMDHCTPGHCRLAMLAPAAAGVCSFLLRVLPPSALP